jgi:hypothetical protein
MLGGNQAEKGPGDQMMIPCIVMGDSIAVGVAQFRPDCESVAQSGITSKRYIDTLLQAQSAQIVIISLGVNDDDTVDTLANLREVRRNVRGRIVYWLLPGIKPRARAAISAVAGEFGDRLIDTTAQAGPDHLHPTGAGYQYLAAMTKMEGASSALPIPTTTLAGPDHLHPTGAAYKHMPAITKVAVVRSTLPIPPRPPLLTGTHKSRAYSYDASANILHSDETKGH